MDFAKLAGQLVQAGFPNGFGDRLPSAAADFPGQVAEAFTFTSSDGVLVLLEGLARLGGGPIREVEYLAICRGETSNRRIEDASGEGSVPALELAECRVIYSQPAQAEASAAYAISLQRMELEVMRRLAGAGFKVALSETGTLPPGVQDDWLGEAMREDFAARLAAANAAIVSSPDDPDLHAEKGALQLARGRYREAAASFAAALAIDGADPSAWRGLGDALLRMGRSEAEVAFERAERPVPVSPEAAARDPVVRTALEMVPPPLREVSCQACGGRQGAWIDPDLYRCQACGRVSDPSSPSGPTSTGGRQ